jgi:hypothetical protein
MSAENHTRRVYTVETACARAEPPPKLGGKIQKKRFWGLKLEKNNKKLG